MRVNLSKFTSALNKLTAYVGTEKNNPGVMLQIAENGELNMCFYNGNLAFIEKLEAEINPDSDIIGNIVLNYARLVSIISVCQPSGNIVAENLDFLFADRETHDVSLSVLKQIRVLSQSTEETLEGTETSTDGTVLNPLSVFEQHMQWSDPAESMKTSVLNRIDYNNIFKGDESEKLDVWDSSELTKLLSRTSNEKGKQVYISSAKKLGFVNNTAYLTTVPLSGDKLNTVVLTTDTAKKILDVIGKAGSEVINLWVYDTHFCCIYDDEKTFGLQFTVADAIRTNVQTLDRYTSGHQYSSINFTFITEALKNVINAAKSTNSIDKIIMNFTKSTIDPTKVQLNIGSSDTKSSTKNDYTLVCEKCDTEDMTLLDNLKIEVAMTVLLSIINDCKSEFIGLDLDIDETGSKWLRICDIDLEKVQEERERALNTNEVSEDGSLPSKVLLSLRSLTLGASNYTAAAR